MNNTLFDSRHIIEKIQNENTGQNEYKAGFDIYSRVRAWEKGQASSRRVHINKKVQWVIVRDTITGTFKIKKYHIDEK